MRLENIGIEEFRKVVYPEYENLFPETERKPYQLIEWSIENSITKVIKIMKDDVFIGFFIINTLKDNHYMVLDYFAILPEYQNKRYGSKALAVLKERSKDYNAIFVEIEKCGLGSNEEENMIRERRAKFYERLGFYKMDFDLNLYDVIYSTYILPCTKKEFDNEEVAKEIFKIYIAISGESRVKNNCKAIF